MIQSIQQQNYKYPNYNPTDFGVYTAPKTVSYGYESTRKVQPSTQEQSSIIPTLEQLEEADKFLTAVESGYVNPASYATASSGNPFAQPNNGTGELRPVVKGGYMGNVLDYDA